MARPITYTDGTMVAVRTAGRSARLKPRGERRAIINYMVDEGGIVTLKQIDDHFGYAIRSKVVALLKAGWLELVA